MIVKGRNRDTAWFSMLDSEWPARKAAFERWLSPDNFDGQGRQKIALSDLMPEGWLMTPTIADKRRRFAELHQAPGCFVMPNPFDIGSAKYLASLGFPALATTSAGMAFAAGRTDGAVDRAYALSHIPRPRPRDRSPAQCGFRGRLRDATPRASTRARGFASAPASPAFRSRTTPATATRRSSPLSEAVERLRAARAAIDASGETVLLTARSEAILREAGGLTEALRRLAAYAEAGADVLYAPLLKTTEEVAEVVRVAGSCRSTCSSAGRASPAASSRTSASNGSASAARSPASPGARLMRAAKDIAENGRFDAFAELPRRGRSRRLLPSALRHDDAISTRSQFGSRQEGGDVDHSPGEECRGERTRGQAREGCVCAFVGLPVGLDGGANEVDDPYLVDAKSCVERKLDSTVIAERAVGDFNEQEDVGGSRMACAIVVGARP